MIIFFTVILSAIFIGLLLLTPEHKTRLNSWILASSLVLGILVTISSLLIVGSLIGLQKASTALFLIIPVFIFLSVLKTQKKIIFGKPSLSKILILVMVFVVGSLAVLLSTHIILEDKSGNLMTGESTYGDLPFHLSQISQLVHQSRFPPQNPFLMNTPLVYPYFINLFSAYLVNLGVSLRSAIIFPGIVLGMAFVYLLYYFYFLISNERKTALLGTVFFFFEGGLGFWYLIKNPSKIVEFLKDPLPFPDYSHVFGENIQWANFLTRIMVPERSVLLGMPMGLTILIVLFFHRNEKLPSYRSLSMAAFLTGLLPFSHTHTFLVFSITLPTLLLFEFLKIASSERIEWIKRWAFFGLITFLIASPQLFYILKHVSGSEHFVRFHIGWMSNPGLTNLILFWFKNTGVFLPLILYAFFLRRTPFFLKKLLVASFGIFILINLLIFQPYDWDNVKFLFWLGIFGSLAAAIAIHNLWQSRLGKVAGVVLTISLCASGLLSLYRETNVSYQLFSKEDREAANWLVSSTAPEALVLTAPVHNSFVSNLAGRTIVMGYPGMLWVHGIPYGEVEMAVRNIYKGKANSFYEIKRLGISYIVVGPVERAEMLANEEYFAKSFCSIYTSKNYTIYDVNCLQ